MARSRRHELGVGCLVLAALALLAWMSLKVGAIQGLGESVQVEVRLSDAGGLTDGASVKIAGVDVGQVDGLRVEHDVAVVGVVLERQAAVRNDVIVQVRARSVLGEKYLALVPQSAGAPLLQDGDVLTEVRPQTEIDELVNQLGPLLAAVDPEALNAAMDALNQAFEEDPDRATRMLTDLETILRNGAEASVEAPALVSEGRQTLRSVRQTVDDARPVIKRADTVVARMEDATVDLPQTVEDIDALVGETRAAVSEGRAVIATIEGSTDDIEKVLGNLSEIDKWELRRLLREEGIVVRLKAKEVEQED